MNIHNAIAISAIHGIDAFIIFSNGKSVTFCAAYRQTPTGGVIRPKESVITRIMVKLQPPVLPEEGSVPR